MNYIVHGVAKSQTWLSDCHFTFNKLIGYSELTISGFPGGSVVKNLPASAGDTGLIPGLGRSPGGGHDNPLQYSCLRIPWTEQPGGLASMGMQRVGHDWATKHSTVQHLVIITAWPGHPGAGCSPLLLSYSRAVCGSKECVLIFCYTCQGCFLKIVLPPTSFFFFYIDFFLP